MTNFAHTCTECGEVYKWRGVDVCGPCFKSIKAERDQLREQIAQCNEIVVNRRGVAYSTIQWTGDNDEEVKEWCRVRGATFESDNLETAEVKDMEAGCDGRTAWRYDWLLSHKRGYVRVVSETVKGQQYE